MGWDGMGWSLVVDVGALGSGVRGVWVGGILCRALGMNAVVRFFRITGVIIL
jgi:hypothetical protein